MKLAMKKTILSVSGMVAVIGMILVPLAAFADASASSSSPYVQTYTTPNGVTVDMSLPNNFKGQVYTVYNNGQWQTYSTTTPLSSTDITNMQNQIEAEEASIQQLFAEQEQLFQQQQKMFQNMFGGL